MSFKKILYKIKEFSGFLSLVIVIGAIIFAFTPSGQQANFARVVTGTANYNTDPNPTADYTGQYDEYITNVSDGTWGFGSADLVTTGTLGSGTYTNTSYISLTGSQMYLNADQVRLGYTSPDSTQGYGQVRVKVWNCQTGGNDIAAGDVLVWYETAVEVAADTVKQATARMVMSLNGDTGTDLDCYAYIKVTKPATAADDTVSIWGKDPSGTSIVESLIITSTDTTYRYSGGLYADIDSIKTTYCDETGDYEFDAIYFMAVKACDGDNGDIMGVAETAIADSGGTGWAIISGPVYATVDAASAFGIVGTHLIGASGGDAVTISDSNVDAAKNGDIVGFLLQPATHDNLRRLIFVDRK